VGQATSFSSYEKQDFFPYEKQDFFYESPLNRRQFRDTLKQLSAGSQQCAEDWPKEDGSPPFNKQCSIYFESTTDSQRRFPRMKWQLQA
jgi:hypothetical protein